MRLILILLVTIAAVTTILSPPFGDSAQFYSPVPTGTGRPTSTEVPPPFPPVEGPITGTLTLPDSPPVVAPPFPPPARNRLYLPAIQKMHPALRGVWDNG